jgi:hypothetical protein
VRSSVVVRRVDARGRRLAPASVKVPAARACGRRPGAR